MQPYSGIITKEQFVAEIKLHQKLDNFIKGTYDRGDKGCAVGCAIKSINKLTDSSKNCSEHRVLEIYGIMPEWMARLQDSIFEGLPLIQAKKWPLKLAKALQHSTNLEKVKVGILSYILRQNISIQKKNLIKNPKLANIIERVIKVNNYVLVIFKLKSAAWSAAKSAAESACSAAGSAWSAAESAAGSAVGSAARSAACSAARSAAWSAWSAARSAAESAAKSAAESACSAARSACSAAWSAAWSAAESAAESAAGSAVGSAAESAAGSAVGSAAESDMFIKISKQLIKLIKRHS